MLFGCFFVDDAGAGGFQGGWQGSWEGGGGQGWWLGDDAGGELISATGEREDDAFVVFAEGFAQDEDLVAEVGVFDEALGPDRLNELGFEEWSTGVCGHVGEQVKGFAGDGKDGSAAAELAKFGVEGEVSEDQVVDFARHETDRELLRTFETNSRRQTAVKVIVAGDQVGTSGREGK